MYVSLSFEGKIGEVSPLAYPVLVTLWTCVKSDAEARMSCKMRLEFAPRGETQFACWLTVPQTENGDSMLQLLRGARVLVEFRTEDGAFQTSQQGVFTDDHAGNPSLSLVIGLAQRPYGIVKVTKLS